MDCPKCGFSAKVGGLDSCPKCGAIYAKAAEAARLAASRPKVKTPAEIVVTTGEDLGRPYRVIGPVFTHVSTRGGMLDTMAKKYGISGPTTGDAWDFVLGMVTAEVPAAHRVFPTAFAVCAEGLRRAAVSMNGDAVIALRQDIDITDFTVSQNVFMQMYGTVVAFQPQ